MEYTNPNCIRIDWKEEIGTTVSLLKSKWPEFTAVISNSNFIELVANYDSETTDEYLVALGQEFSIHGLSLYNIVEDSDSYCLVLLEDQNKAAFEKLHKENKIRFELQKQSRKKWGAPAKRLKLAKQIPYEKQQIKGDLRLKFPLSVLKNRTHTKEGAFKNSAYSFVNTADWPLQSFETRPVNYFAFSKMNGLYAAIFENTETRTGIVKISSTPFEIKNWQEIQCDDDMPVLAFPFWIDEDLLILAKKAAWLVSSASSGTKTCKKIFEVTTERKFIRGEFPRVFKTLDDSTYILLNFIFYRWENSKLVNTGLFALEHTDFSAFPTGKNRFVYIAMGTLVEVDFKTKKTRTRRLEFMDTKSSIQIYTDGWAVLKRYGHTNKAIDIAQFWHCETDTWIRMPLGKIGKHGIRDIFLHPEGYTIINTGDNLVLKIEDLVDSLRAESKNIFQLADWSDNWGAESDRDKKESKISLWDRMKTIFEK